jgi:predicted metal-dependent phosphoesterase TrpH
MKKRIDLHLHTNRSDGLCSPAEVLQFVRDRGLAAFAIADHDTVEGFLEARELLKSGDPELVPAVELSCSRGNGDLHVLAYCFDPEFPELREALQQFQETRNQRGRLMVQKLNDMGIDISFTTVEECANGAPVGRPHVADALRRIGAVSSFDAAFNKYIGDRAPAFVPKPNVLPRDAIDMIHRAGGVAVLAHPMVARVFLQLDELVEDGLDGVEAFHPDHRRAEADRLVSTAERHRLVVTGGSDFHGREKKYGLIGSEPVTVDHLLKLKQAAEQKRGQP